MPEPIHLKLMDVVNTASSCANFVAQTQILLLSVTGHYTRYSCCLYELKVKSIGS